MRLLFVRHGEPDYVNDCLTETGHLQAQAAANRLKAFAISEIWTSPYGRARQTAEYTAEALGLPINTLESMRELDWGSRDDSQIFADGHPWSIADEMAQKGMDLNDPDWRSNQYFINNRVVDSVERVETGIDEWLRNFGYVRNGYYYDHSYAEETHRTIALFCHGGSSSAAIGHILNLTFPYMCALLHTGFAGQVILRFGKDAGSGILPCLENLYD